jgi:hypothetical protein
MVRHTAGSSDCKAPRDDVAGGIRPRGLGTSATGVERREAAVVYTVVVPDCLWCVCVVRWCAFAAMRGDLSVRTQAPLGLTGG